MTAPSLLLLSAGGFCASAGIRLLDPLLPMVARDFGVAVGQMGAVVAAFALPYGLSQVVMGPLGDRLGKLRMVAVALLLYGLAHLAAAWLAGSLGALALLRALGGAFAGAVMPLLLAHLGDTVPYAERQATISRFLTGSVMAFLLTGPLVGVAGEAGGWRLAFALFGTVACLVGALLAWRLGPALWQPAGVAGGGGFRSYLRLLRQPAGRRLLLAAFLDGGLLVGGAFPFIGSFLIEHLGHTAGEAGLVIACFGFGAFAYTRLARRLLARLGESGMLVGGGVLIGLGLAGIAVAPAWWVVAPIQALLGFGFFLLHGTLQARATEALPEARGTSVSAFVMALFLGQSLGSIAFGALIGAVGYRAGFGIGAAAVGLFALWARRG
ncbi:MFS transporter [Roseomonas sp. NAR14]|uniref:MFS transporter n=1 Tax=Roseomonas acroporae TaxID=2937791 RepID=A0A9X2BYH4_9PROT|nr:MFS transporter [Roseomonas acroporae]MCK8786015.1 MFS transporter [Roseomonas acroporae]